MSPEQLVLAEHGVLAAFASAALVWIMSAFARGYVSAKHDKDPWWWQGGLRALCVAAGVLTGLALDTTVEGACVGAAGGLFSTTLVAVVKARLKSIREGGQ